MLAARITLPPLLGFVGNERAEIDLRATEDNAAEVGELSPQLGIGDAGFDLLVELVDDLDRRVARCADAKPAASLTEAVVRAPADGYILLMVGPSNAINATLYDKLNFNFVRDIAPVAPIVRFPYIMMVNPAVPAKTLPEFIAYTKANPGK